MAHVTLSAADNGRTVECPVGKSVHIVINGNPTTGYVWTRAGFEKTPDMNDANLRLNREYQSANTGMMGSGGQYHFDVTPQTAGSHKVELVNCRTFEEKPTPVATFTITINSA